MAKLKNTNYILILLKIKFYALKYYITVIFIINSSIIILYTHRTYKYDWKNAKLCMNWYFISFEEDIG